MKQDSKRPRQAAADQIQDRAGKPPAAGGVWRQVGVVFAVALVARAIHFLAMRDSVFYEVLVCDGRQYDLWARQIAAGNWIGDDVFYQTPLYPYLLAVIYALAGHSLWAVRIMQALLGAVSCALLARAGSAWFSPRVGWICGLMLAVYPPAIFFDGIIQKASVDLLLMTGLLWATGAAQQRPRPGLLATSGVLLGTMALNRENAVVLIPAVALWAMLLDGKPRETGASRVQFARGAVARLVAVLTGVALVLVPVGMRNQYVGGQFLLTTSQMGPNFYIGNHAGASGMYEPLRPDRGDPIFERADAKLLAEQDLGRALSPGEISDYWMARSWHDIQEDPGAWLRLLARKWLLTWHRIELVDAEGIRVHARESWLLTILAWWHFGVLCPLAAAGLWLTRREWRRLWLLYAVLAMFALAVALFFVFARYRYPLAPVCLLFAGAAIAQAWEQWSGRGSAAREWFGGAVAAGLVAVACNWPLSGLENDEVTYITAANGLMDDGRAEDAVGVLRVAQRIKPRSVVVLHNLGTASTKARQYDAAQRYLQQAIELDPRHALSYHALGDVLRERGDLAGAERAWRKAIEIDPLLALPHRALGSLALVRGKPAAAIEELRRALALDGRYFAARVELALALLAGGDVTAAQEQLALVKGYYPQPREANNLAWILATAPEDELRDPQESLRLARFACEATGYNEPELLDTLAAAEANAGNFPEAIRRSDQALTLVAKSKSTLRQGLVDRRELYLQGRPFRDQSLLPADGGRGN